MYTAHYHEVMAAQGHFATPAQATAHMNWRVAKTGGYLDIRLHHLEKHGAEMHLWVDITAPYADDEVYGDMELLLWETLEDDTPPDHFISGWLEDETITDD